MRTQIISSDILLQKRVHKAVLITPVLMTADPEPDELHTARGTYKQTPHADTQAAPALQIY